MPIASNIRYGRRNAILLVEHNAFTRRLIRRLLREAGIEKVVEAPDAATADLVLKTNPVDAILLDWPAASGRESARLLARLRHADNPQSAMTPVIITSTQVDLDLLQRAATLNASSVLLKPFSQGALRSHLIAALGAPEARPSADPARPEPADTLPLAATADETPALASHDSEIFYL